MKRKKRKDLDKYVISAMLYIVAWSVAFFAAWIIRHDEPGVLEGCILAPGALELVCAAWIKQGKDKNNGGNNISDGGVDSENGSDSDFTDLDNPSCEELDPEQSD